MKKSLALLILAMGVLPVAAQTKYVVTDLGGLGGTFTSVNGINNTGQVVGSSNLPGDVITHAFRTAPNQPVKPGDDLGTLGGANSVGSAINNTGQVAGRSDTADVGPFGSTVSRAFRADPGLPMVGLGTLAPLGGVNGFNNSGANGINDAGRVAGFATVPFVCSSVSHAFLTSPNSPINPAFDNLGTLVSNCRSSTAFGVNSSGMTVGDSATNVLTGVPNHAFRHTFLGGMVDLGTLGGRDSVAYAVNDLGEIVGQSQVPSDLVNNPFNSPHAFLSQGNVAMRDLGTLGGTYSSARAINRRSPLDSQIVGQASTAADAAFHAFLYTGNISAGTMVDLNGLIAASSGWELIGATGINNKGQIVGTAWRNGVKFVNHAVRLDPSDVAVTNLVTSLSDPSLGLTIGQVSSLTDKLQNALASIQQGLNQQAVNQLSAFISSVQTLQKNNKITNATANILIIAAQAIIAALS